MLRRPKHSEIEVVAPREEEVIEPSNVVNTGMAKGIEGHPQLSSWLVGWLAGWLAGF
jgi:hypothetical protein